MVYRLFFLFLFCFLIADAGRRRKNWHLKRLFRRAGCSSDPQPCSQSELDNLGKKIWREDTNRVVTGRAYTLNLQANSGHDGKDFASRPLFRWVDPSVLQKPTVKAMVALFDNYYRAVGAPEYETSIEISENWNFVNSIIATRPMELVYQFLLRKKIVCSMREFKSKLYYIWFKLYSRRRSRKRNNGGLDSSGFEHVFVGETDSEKTLGLHNWVQFYLEEKRGNINYNGYIGELKQSNVITCQFTWHSRLKKIGGAMIGTSPEFDFAIYSLTFLSKVRQPVFHFGPDSVKIKCYGISGGKIGTCYPILLRDNDR